MDAAVVILRWVQMAGAMILFGSSLFCLYALPRTDGGSEIALQWPKRLLISSAGAVLIACILGFLAQTAVLAGSVQDALQPDALTAAATGMSFGKSSIVRAAIAGLSVIGLVFAKPGRGTLGLATLAGGVLCASFAWMGHGAATEGAAGLLHTVADIVHALAAGVWIGALVAFFLLLRPRAPSAELDRVVHGALHGFSGIGSALVAVLIVSGLVNSWFLVGLSGVSELWTTPYGELLSLKLAVFVGMLGLAAANRFRLTPALGAATGERDSSAALAALRRSLILETALAFLVVGLVAWLGTLEPLSAQ